MTEFDDVIRRLQDERPQATPLELDAIKQRVRRGAADPSRRSTQSMKSRFAILGMLVAGLLFSTAGAGLAVSGLNSSSNASLAQYGAATPTPTPVCTATPTPTRNQNNAACAPCTENQSTSDTSPSNSTAPCAPCTENQSAGNGGTTSPTAPTSSEDCGEGGVLPAEAENAPSTASDSAPSADSGVAPATETQTTRQAAAAANTSQLPFTGFAAIPVLLGGLALLSGGLVLRRRTRSE